MLGTALPPRAVPTAWAVLALHHFAPATVSADDIAALHHGMAEDGGALALAWGVLALQRLEQEPFRARGRPGAAGRTDETERLLALQAADGSWNQNAYHTAVALMATGA